MTVTLKEWDGQRSVEIEHRDGIVFFDGGRYAGCFAFDKALLLRALKREVEGQDHSSSSERLAK